MQQKRHPSRASVSSFTETEICAYICVWKSNTVEHNPYSISSTLNGEHNVNPNSYQIREFTCKGPHTIERLDICRKFDCIH